MNKILKWTLIIVVGLYVGIVVLFETWLGYSQPQGQSTMIITTTNSEGEKHPRVVSKLEVDGTLYVAVNHWPRLWYWQILENPEVTVEIGDESNVYVATELEGDAYDAVNEEHSLGLVFRILTGFPPRRILRLDPA